MTIAIDRCDQAVWEMLPCRTNDPDVFFAESPTEAEYAKQLCRACPLQVECLAGALERQEPWGVWGGEIFQQGVVIERKRPRGRPRKHPVAPAAQVPVQRTASVEDAA